MTIYELMRNPLFVKQNPCFFDMGWRRFFGERMSEMRVLKRTETFTNNVGDEVTCYVISTRQRNAPAGVEQRRHHYINVNTFEREFKQ